MTTTTDISGTLTLDQTSGFRTATPQAAATSWPPRDSEAAHATAATVDDVQN